jgi:hypothetical protein
MLTVCEAIANRGQPNSFLLLRECAVDLRCAGSMIEYLINYELAGADMQRLEEAKRRLV